VILSPSPVSPASHAPSAAPTEHESRRRSGQRRPAPVLHLVAPHEHAWRLRTVEYDDALEVRRYECETCEDVLFR
jgi:hypothetical protein